MKRHPFVPDNYQAYMFERLLSLKVQQVCRAMRFLSSLLQ